VSGPGWALLSRACHPGQEAASRLELDSRGATKMVAIFDLLRHGQRRKSCAMLVAFDLLELDGCE
jgi:hypothetical protein